MARTKKKDTKADLAETPESSESIESQEEDDYLELDDELEEGELARPGYLVKKKPELSPEMKRTLNLRKARKAKKGTFRRQEWFRYKRLGTKWRKPRGLHSKMRRGLKYRPKMPSVGYGSPRGARNLHPSGFREVMVYNINDLETIDPSVEAARIGHGVGTRKRISIEEKAAKLKIRILNPGVSR